MPGILAETFSTAVEYCKRVAAQRSAIRRQQTLKPGMVAVIMRWRPRILKKAELTAWPHNGLRHSFASYHLAKLQDMNKTADPLGTMRT